MLVNFGALDDFGPLLLFGVLELLGILVNFGALVLSNFFDAIIMHFSIYKRSKLT